MEAVSDVICHIKLGVKQKKMRQAQSCEVCKDKKIVLFDKRPYREYLLRQFSKEHV